MATVLKSGPRTWSMQRDSEGYRNYSVQFLVQGDVTDGPANVLRTPGLPLPGAFWNIGSDVDLWAWCRADASIKIHEEKSGERNRWWTVDMVFSNKPMPPDKQRCQDVQVEDPLLEPPKIGGGYTKEKEEATQDRFGSPILNSAWEQIRGPHVEFDSNRQTVRIEQNVATIEQALTLPAAMMDHLNDRPLWGVPKRCIKLSQHSWDRKYYGQCFVYYSRTLEFDVNAKTFDRDLLDEGTKCLHGENRDGSWIITPIDSMGTVPNRTNPLHFIKYKDAHGENSRVILDGLGKPIIAATNIMTCSQCPGGAPGYYMVSGHDNPKYNLSLAYQGGCTWSATISVAGLGVVGGAAAGFGGPTETVTLKFNDPLYPDEWSLQVTTIPIGQQVTVDYTALATWSCLGSNVMSRVVNPLFAAIGGAAIGGRGCVVTAVTSNPGKIHLEKFEEANFLLLNIPTQF